MKEAFFGINVAMRGLYTAQRNLDVVNHNLNNINTPGYSRQQTVQQASRPMPIYDGTGMVGTGSDVIGVKRIRDEYLDFKFQSENNTMGEWGAKKALFDELEVTFNEPSESGFTQIFNEFYNSFQELGKDPSSGAVRALVRQSGVTFSKYFNSLATRFEKVQTDINTQVKSKVEEVNNLAKQIKQLNSQIYNAELDGNTANDLRDQRGYIIDNLSKIINTEAKEVQGNRLPSGQYEKRMVITISGKALVNHLEVAELKVTQRPLGEKINPEDAEYLYDIGWKDGNQLSIRSGELRGMLDVRDGNDGLNGTPNVLGVPHYINKLNEFVRTFALSFNEGIVNGEDGMGHVDGYEGDSVTGAPEPAGIRFFTCLNAKSSPLNSTDFEAGGVDIEDAYSQITAGNICVGAEIMQDTKWISVSDAGGEKGNIVILNNLTAMRHDISMFNEGAPEDFMKATVATLGIDSQQATRYASNQEAIMNQIENRKLSDSSVSIDEEMANMVKYQHAYSAAAKMIATLSEIYDVLINRTGV